MSANNVIKKVINYRFKGPWATSTGYAVRDQVEEGGSTYTCRVAHTSGTFATDLAANKWDLYSQGLPDPNLSTSTTTDISGYLFGNGTNLQSASGAWIPFPATLTYSSIDDPTAVVTISGDYTGVFSDGMRVMMTNAGNLVCGIISKTPTYSSPNTTISFLQEINPSTGTAAYPLEDSAITAAYYSHMKAPYSFPLEPLKWSVFAKDTTGATQGSPSASTWYNLASVSLSVPIGSWDLGYYHLYGVQETSGTTASVQTTLSTANNSESDTSFTFYSAYIGPTGSITLRSHAHRERSLSVTAKTAYYLNTMTAAASNENLYSYGNIKETVVYAISSLL